jgi:hypothetical protein
MSHTDPQNDIPWPVLYLDFDGVLNDADWCGSDDRSAAIQAHATANDCGKFKAMLALAPLHDLRPHLVARVARIIAETDARLIVCSSWRTGAVGMTDDDLRATLARVGLPFDGVTPRQAHKMSVHDIRERDIAAHVATLPPGVRWCVLDDDVSEARFPGRVVRPDDGVTEADADRVVQILTAGEVTP